MKFIQLLIYVIFLIISENEITNSVEQGKGGKYWPQPETDYNPNSGPSKEECERRIYSKCNYPTVFTDEELENVRQFLNYSFTVLADIKPDKPLCPKLHVQQDWKCLSKKQKTKVLNVWKQMYERRDIQRLTDLHVKKWPTWHKTHEFFAAHRWLLNEFETIMRSIDNQTTLPYWDPYTYGSQPERSSIWDTLGHSGNYSNGYSVCDGVYAEWGLIPQMRRHWSPRGTIYPWFTQEFQTFLLQSSKSYLEIIMRNIPIHFSPHLLVGGYEGQYSIPEAPYDLLFYMHHLSDDNLFLLKWQLQSPQSLTPSFHDFHSFDVNNGNIKIPNKSTETLSGVPWVKIKEMYWVGFGNLCFIQDQMVRPINNLMKGLKDPVPEAAKRLPRWIIDKYFPLFAQGKFSALYHTMEDVGDCNNVCHPIPKPTLMKETEIGRKQLQAYRFDGGLDIGTPVELVEKSFVEMWLDLNKANYCSPYVTTY